ncbi:MAG: peptide chain release factor N(5)-glutamine methyltransferase [Clostridia bacterium]|nr:peptide chain release factor N(5)-glutamine methyltransferase [Clostridia bacterium]
MQMSSLSLKNKFESKIMKDKKLVIKSIFDAIKDLDDYSYGEEELLCLMTLKITREALFKKEKFNQRECNRIDRVLCRRLKNEPLNKIFKRQNFFGIDFFINNYVLAPRIETEILTEMALKKIKLDGTKVLDLCCGSGCIGLSLAKFSVIKTEVVLSDIDDKALLVAKKNRKMLKLDGVKIVKSDLFEGLKKFDKFDIITCNPPYIKSEDIKNLSKGVKNFDPHLALDGGETGLKFFEKIAENAGNFLKKKGIIFFEIGFDEKFKVQEIFEKKGFVAKCFKDYSGLDRVVEIKRGNDD